MKRNDYKLNAISGPPRSRWIVIHRRNNSSIGMTVLITLVENEWLGIFRPYIRASLWRTGGMQGKRGGRPVGAVRPHGVEVAARPRAGTDTPKRICQVKNEKTRHLSTSLVVGDYWAVSCGMIQKVLKKKLNHL